MEKEILNRYLPSDLELKFYSHSSNTFKNYIKALMDDVNNILDNYDVISDEDYIRILSRFIQVKTDEEMCEKTIYDSWSPIGGYDYHTELYYDDIVKNESIITKNDMIDLYNFVNDTDYKCLTSLKTKMKYNYCMSDGWGKDRTEMIIPTRVDIIILTSEQMRAYNEIKTSTNNKILLHGVTGSGKTEIYIKLIEDTLVLGKSVIMLVPEISLTPQIVNRFKSDFGDDVAVLHSGLSEREKFDEYRRIVNKEVSIVVGARSAVFAPLSNIGLIIIDECSSPSFKQDVNPKYNSIDVAFMRSETYKCKVVMGSATPLLEQYARGQKGVFKLVSLTSRVSNNLPNYVLVDMNKEVKKRNFIISSVLKEKINDTIKSDKQVILLLNRRGYSTFLSCSSCGFVWKCPSCDISLIYHKSTNNLRCHYCGYTTKMTNICPKCKEDAIKDLGMGTEKLESIINKMFPLGRTVRMDLDTTRNKGSHSKIIEDFKNHKYNILIGTQMISKGLNFKDVTLVGVINADASLNIPDFRSSERTFELLTQTGGRTGRYDLPGDVVIQTYNKDNYCLECVKKGDYIDFYTKEMKIRKDLKYPPYYYLTTIKIISDKYELARDEANNVKKYLTRNLNEGIIVLGPSTASVFKLMNKYYFQIILKYKNEANMLEVLKNINEMYITNKVSVDININPLNLL